MNEEYLNQEEPKTAISKKEFEEYDTFALESMLSCINSILSDRAGEFYNNDYEKFYDIAEAMFLKYPKHNAFSLGEKSELNWNQFFELLPLPEGRA